MNSFRDIIQDAWPLVVILIGLIVMLIWDIWSEKRKRINNYGKDHEN